MAEDPAVRARGLEKRYGGFQAVRGIDFEVRPGEVFGLLGPNGAGKTTTVEILEGLRPRTSGEVSVLGYDPGVQVNSLKQRIGVCLQSTVLPDKITVTEALELFASFYVRTMDHGSLLKRLQIWEKRHSFYSRLSGGQKQRLALALALINDPQLVFLDEPTTGLDAQVRLEIHSLIEELKGDGRTVLLTTHYIEEAERLCDRVAILDEGRIIALGSPRELQERTLGLSFIEVRCASALPGELPRFPECGEISRCAEGRGLRVSSSRPARTLVEMVRWIDQQGFELTDIHLKRPTLEDVFLKLTGKRLRE